MSYKFKYGNKEIHVPKTTESLLYKYDLGPNVNLNNLTQEGYYHQPSNANTSTSYNYPIAEAGLLMVINRCYIYQTYQTYNNSGFYYRSCSNEAWSFWKKITSVDMLTWDNLLSKPSLFSPSNHNHAYATWLGKQYASGEEWLGFYNATGGSRKGWIGHDNSNILKITNEVGAGEINLTATYGAKLMFEGDTGNYGGYFLPSPTNRITLGSVTYRWFCTYQYLSSINTSDEREKHDICEIGNQIAETRSIKKKNIYELLFHELIAKNYKMNEEIEDKIHIGFIAQDISKSLNNLGLDENDFGFINHEFLLDKETNEKRDFYGLRYEEFIALNTHMIQKLYRVVEQQQEQIDELKEQMKIIGR